jgi:hypothetical protein
MHISIAKAQNGCDVIQVRIQWASDVTAKQKEKLQAFILSKSQSVADKVSSSSLAITIRQGKQHTLKTLEALLQSIDDGRKVVSVKCYSACEQLYFIEVRDSILKAAGIMQQTAIDLTSVASQRVFDATSRIAGEDRATGMFTLVGKRLPFVKVASQAVASTGSISDSSSEVERNVESCTGSTGKAAVPMIKPGHGDAPNDDEHVTSMDDKEKPFEMLVDLQLQSMRKQVSEAQPSP